MPLRFDIRLLTYGTTRRYLTKLKEAVLREDKWLVREQIIISKLILTEHWTILADVESLHLTRMFGDVVRLDGLNEDDGSRL